MKRVELPIRSVVVVEGSSSEGVLSVRVTYWYALFSENVSDLVL